MFDDSKPIFQQLADSLSDDILRGIYAEGEQVPSTNELAAFMRINPATAGKALNLLVDDGVLFKRRGLGMFVADGARERIASERRERFAKRYIAPLIAEARALGLSRDDLIRLIGAAEAPDGASTSDTEEKEAAS